MSIIRNLKNFSIEQICVSGQCFRMNDITDCYVENKAGKESNSPKYEKVIEVIAFGKRLIVKQAGEEVTFDCSEDDYEKIWVPYFDINTDYGKIISLIDDNDLYLKNAAEKGYGIRILRQDLFEMIISFIISQRNNIKRIRKSVSLLSEKYGVKIVLEDGTEFYDFPTPKALAEANVDDLRAIGTGYRDVYIKRAAEAVYYGDFDLDKLRSMDYRDAKAYLLSLYGIGEKVADCVCLFALHLTESFPKDTHINQVLDREYKSGFDFDRYKESAGILQQYMFYNELFK